MNDSAAFFEKYELAEQLGTGAFSEVKIGIEKDTGLRYAVKIIDKAKCKGKETMIETEVKILKRARHDNIIRLYEMYEFNSKIFLVMELATGGELFDDIVKRGKYTESDASSIIHKILRAIEYLHSIGIAHRDLKPENLLLSDKTTHPKIMISDFGLSKLFNEDEIMKTACGTPGYVAPEVLKRQGYDRNIDLWSIGVITYILLCGYPPFYDENNVQLFKQIMAGKFEFDRPYWDNISDIVKDFIRKLLVTDPKKRYTVKQALAHPFITKYNSKSQPVHEKYNLAPMIQANMQNQSRANSGNVLGILKKESTEHFYLAHDFVPEKTHAEMPGRPIGQPSPIDDSAYVKSTEVISSKKSRKSRKGR